MNAILVMGSSANFYWIGGNDLATRNRWVWASKGYRIYPYVNWMEKKPTRSENANSEGQCIALDPSQNFQWRDESCGSTKAYFFCEIRIEKVKLILSKLNCCKS